MAIQLGGLVSGFDTQSLITALIQNDTKPLDLMASKKDRLEQAQNAWKDVNMRLSNLRSTVNVLKNSDTFKSRLVASSNDRILSASAGSAAVNGTYQLKINHLAEYNRYATFTAASLTGDDEANANTVLGMTGTFTVRSSDSTENGVVTVEISDSLQDVANKINAAASGVTASIVENRLVIRSNTMGINGEIVLSNSEILDAEHLNLFQTTAAQDAEIEYEGLTFTRSSNYISDLISGVNLNLTGTSDGAYVFLTISPDTDRAIDAIRNFVDQYNSLLNYIEENTFVKPADRIDRTTSTYDPYAPYDSSRQRGILQGDATIIGLESQLRRMINTSLSGFSPMLNSLSAVGITTSFGGIGKKQVGYLSFDEGKFAQAMSDPVGPASITARSQLPVQFNAFNSKTVADITGNESATTNRTALGLFGTVDIKVGGGSTVSIQIDENCTLADVRNRINEAAAGVTASIKDNQLVVTSNTMGIPGQISFSNNIGITGATITEIDAVINDISLSNIAISNKNVEIASALPEDLDDLLADKDALLAAREALIEDLHVYGPVSVDRSLSDDQIALTFMGKLVLDTGNNVDTSEITISYMEDYLKNIDPLRCLTFTESALVSDANYAIKKDQGASFTMDISGKSYFIELKGPMTSQEIVRQINSVIGHVATASLNKDNRLTFTTLEQGINATITIKETFVMQYREKDSVGSWESSLGELTGLGIVSGTTSRGKDLDAFFTANILDGQATVTSRQPLGNNPVTGSGGKLTLNIDGVDYVVEFVGNYNIGDIANKINSVIGKAGQAYLDDNNFLVIRSLKSGDGSTVRVVSFDRNLEGLNLITGQSATAAKGLSGIAVTLDKYYEAWVTSGGILTQKQNSLGGQITDIQKQMDALTARIDNKVEFLWKQFSNMEKKLQDLSSQSQVIDTYLTNLLNNTSSYYSNK